MLKICIWMNIPSHYQSTFFEALDERDDIDLKVVYLYPASSERVSEGWNDAQALKAYETVADGVATPERIEILMPDWRQRIHVLSCYFFSDLSCFFSREGTAWCHWSEMPGIRLAELLNFNVPIYRMLNPLMMRCKCRDGFRIRKYALGAFGQGRLARIAFRLMGVPDSKIADLYYAPASLQSLEPSPEIVRFAAGRKVFLSVGALCRRKGIDVLLKAFARLESSDWCLVLCGLDRSGGGYARLVRKLGISDRVLFLGVYPAHRIAEVYAASDVFVLASRFDGWGAVVNEAASLGLPLIGTDLCGSSWHLIEPDITGYRVRAGSVRSLKDALKRYVADPSLIAQHGAHARERFMKSFTPEKNATGLVDAIVAWSKE